ncbi:MAG: 2-C-methyl-D-erythritol 2,4-cyclodiphosphate synthase [Christensenellales bacterium]|jgi:2-C-methyl-D-erythritol 4-phosphate cytidylyltransferase/2-C-methyl-D-erythritol 2,4-cyclodiphosphate synthase
MAAWGILVAAGSGSRLGADINKVLLPLGGEALFCHGIRLLRQLCEGLILVIRPEDEDRVRAALAQSGLTVEIIVYGGETRRHSVENALAVLPKGADVLLVHDAARPFASLKMAREVLRMARETGAAVPALPVTDTLKKGRDGLVAGTQPRESLYAVQTPQGFSREVLERAYKECADALTDDAGLVERLGLPVAIVPGSRRNIKITLPEDFAMVEQMMTSAPRVGLGYDAHRLVEGRQLILGGVTIPHEKGLLGHSDADVVLHALTDALLGACALGDIGQHFPDSDPAYQGISSLLLLEKTVALLKEKGFRPMQCDLTIQAQRPKLAPHLPRMRANIAAALGVPLDKVGLKATTTEGLDFVGREEGIAVQAVAVVGNIMM